VLEVGNGPKFQLLPHFNILKPSSGSNKELKSASAMAEIDKLIIIGVIVPSLLL
jgi:hypothetical protein